MDTWFWWIGAPCITLLIIIVIDVWRQRDRDAGKMMDEWED